MSFYLYRSLFTRHTSRIWTFSLHFLSCNSLVFVYLLKNKIYIQLNTYTLSKKGEKTACLRVMFFARCYRVLFIRDGLEGGLL